MRVHISVYINYVCVSLRVFECVCVCGEGTHIGHYKNLNVVVSHFKAG